MKFSGNNFKLVPKVKEMSFSFASLNVSNNTGSAEIGFSGSGSQIKLSFNNNKVYDLNNKFLYGYESGQALDISGDFTTGEYRLYLNKNLISKGLKDSFEVEKFYVNTTGCNLFSTNLLKGKIPLDAFDVVMEEEFYGGGQVTGQIVNSSDFDIYVYSSQNIYKNNDKQSLSGSVSGEVLRSNVLDFSFEDVNLGVSETTVNFDISLETNIGTLYKPFSLQRLSNLTGDIYSFKYDSFKNASIDHPFSGSGLPSQFLYQGQPSGLHVNSVVYRRYDRTGQEKEKSIDIHVRPESPISGEDFTGTYVSGFSFSNTGFYGTLPSFSIDEYSSVLGLSFNLNNLFSLGCGTEIPFTFDALSGDGLGSTGKARLQLVQLSLYGSSNFYSITGFDFEANGSGYNYVPSISLLTGSLGASCFDVPRVSGSSYVYTPFTGTGIVSPDASYLWGEQLTGASVKTISGQPYTGWSITGFRITNPGSGYITSSGYLPNMTFFRHADDPYSAIASASGLDSTGAFSFNTSGDSYDFTGNWLIRTGFSFNTLKNFDGYYGVLTGYSGTAEMPIGIDKLYVYSYFDQITRDSPVTVSQTIDDQKGNRKSVTIRGGNILSPYSGALKVFTSEVNTGIFIEF
jgi:hypothetical protein